jgi:2-amino-4-hydroxy-6-hydroxymethyldihydropteridine diphosphokinase
MRTGIAIGSNVGDRLAYLRAGRQQVLSIPGVSEPVLSSPIYETEPIGTAEDAGAFLNAVIEVDYSGTASELLDALQAVEAAQGRPSKRPRNAPRTLDLDILYVGNLALSNQEIVIPHPRLHLRRFVLAPLADIRPELILPGRHATTRQLLDALADESRVELYLREW